MSLQEMLAEVEMLSPEDRQVLRHKLDDLDEVLTPEEEAHLDEVMADFDPNNFRGVTPEELRARVMKKLGRQ